MNLLPPDPHEVVVHDLRGSSAAEREDWGLTLEKAGFEVVQGWGSDEEAINSGWAQGKWNDKDWIEGEYYSYVKRMLGKKWGTQTIAIFDHTIRKRPSADSAQVQDDAVTVFPAEQTHIDQTYKAAIERIRIHLGEDAVQRVLRGTAVARICNVWRPLVGPVTDRPLAVADFRSLNEKRDFEETLPAPPGCRTGESQMLRYHTEQRWYYLSRMATDECFLLKCFDSETGVRAPHSAFIDPSTAIDAQQRWSIEVRTASLVDVPT